MRREDAEIISRSGELGGVDRCFVHQWLTTMGSADYFSESTKGGGPCNQSQNTSPHHQNMHSVDCHLGVDAGMVVASAEVQVR